MTEAIFDVTLENGKYRFRQETPGGKISAWRYGEQWEPAEETLEGFRFTNWLIILFCEHQAATAALAARRADDSVAAPVDASTAATRTGGAPKAGPCKARPHGGSSGVLGVEN